MNLEITLEDDRWCALEPLATRAIAAVLDHCELDADMCEISVLGCGDVRIAELNAEFREKPTATNVLSWPADDLAADQAGGIPLTPEPDFTGEIALGDVAISYDTCAREAGDAGKNMDDHVTHLIIHGTLHLLGYDHIRDLDATLMEEVEVEILGKLGIDDPYNV
ncbi:probable rRNA maturation factor [Ruegeria halocynthiae]|uniref:Endoribonuclease YbeY n=1 Tax=Ruegeria halocynthiae TaxID=985054 RepID=A0A1H2W1N3_9RHOB|nr:rRNA maturation RNase YbeY [Ruegeria halocynthiae]SDW74572.1 probable rRNA maturation factor [Ruegeria halocynthiae]